MILIDLSYFIFLLTPFDKYRASANFMAIILKSMGVSESLYLSLAKA